MKSITDSPIERLQDDLLKVERYSIALSNFIKSSDTPITIGLQGEWGTGKTSLMSLVREVLDQADIATSWVNTWEYSMFVDKHETTPRILQGMLDKLQKHCVQQGNWDIGDTGTQAIKTVGKFLGNVANQMVKKQTGVNIREAYEGNPSTSFQSEVAIIKDEIQKVINLLINSHGNPYKKVVFFVDDLDRINPSDAVEVLEALKNIFDIPNCIYVLAIDYDVVVKGLEAKFGPKGPHNEREFRSFFDKIIQVPFSMPTGTYSISNFLEHKLSEMGISLAETNISDFSKVVEKTVGSNPRSLKRYLNSFSLINNVRALDDDGSNAGDFMLFALLGIQISYPHVFRLIVREPDYPNWDKSFASKLNLKWDEIDHKISIFGENDLLDEVWEKILWAICQDDVYLKSRVFQVLSLLNLIREVTGDTLKDELQAALEFASITNVDDDPDIKQLNKSNVRASLDGGLREWCDLKKYDDERAAIIETLIEKLKSSDDQLEEKYSKSMISIRNKSKGLNLLYIKSVSKGFVKCGTPQQLNKKEEFEELANSLPNIYGPTFKFNRIDDEREYIFMKFSIPIEDIKSESFSRISNFVNDYKSAFH